MRKIARWALQLLGWQAYPLPNERPQKSVICVAPHTSNMDFFIGKLYYSSVGTSSAFMMKKDWFFFPLGVLLRWIGGVPIDRSKKGDTVSRAAQQIQEAQEIHLAITPEGTRSYTERWHLGFYHIALEAGVPIEIAVIDYKSKQVGIVEVFHPTGDIQTDMHHIRSHFKQAQAKYPALHHEYQP